MAVGRVVSCDEIGAKNGCGGKRRADAHLKGY